MEPKATTPSKFDQYLGEQINVILSTSNEEFTLSNEAFFDGLKLENNQMALISRADSVITKIKRVEEVTGFTHDEFSHDFYALGGFAHPDDYEEVLYLTRMALENELRHPSGILKTEYSWFTRGKLKDGTYSQFRVTMSTFAVNENHMPTSVLAILSNYGDVKFGKPTGLTVNSREPYIIDDKSKTIRRADDNLTKREKQVLYLMVKGFSSKMIAAELGISKNTVDNFRKKLLSKTNSANSIEMSMKAVINFWI